MIAMFFFITVLNAFVFRFFGSMFFFSEPPG